jgi:hypothetical protein
MEHSFNNSTYDELYKLASKVAEKIDSDESEAFESIGLLLIDEQSRYSENYSPLNSISFARTGGDGVHFGLLKLNNEIDNESPVVMTVPCNIDCINTIVGENLYDFLCLGSVTGFFFLEQLSYKKERYLDTIFDFEKLLKDAYYDQDALDEDEEYIGTQKILLEILRKNLKLCSWNSPEKHFKELQETYLKLVKIPYK